MTDASASGHLTLSGLLPCVSVYHVKQEERSLFHNTVSLRLALVSRVGMNIRIKGTFPGGLGSVIVRNHTIYTVVI